MVIPSLPRVATVVLNHGIPADTESLEGKSQGSAFNRISYTNKKHLLSILPALKSLLILSTNDRYFLILQPNFHSNNHHQDDGSYLVN